MIFLLFDLLPNHTVKCFLSYKKYKNTTYNLNKSMVTFYLMILENNRFLKMIDNSIILLILIFGYISTCNG